jgi:hypothetical protein
MSQDPNISQNSLIPPHSIPAQAEAFSAQVHGLLDGQPKDETTVNEAFAGLDEMFDLIAAGLYNMASMLVGEGEESVRLVETAVATAEVSACDDAIEARKSSRAALGRAAIQLLDRRDPGCLAAPRSLVSVQTCIEDDDLEAAGVSGEELAKMIAGPDRGRVRTWLGGLPVQLRTVFVLRAVAGFTSVETAALMAANGGADAAGWTPEAVREIFRQGLCSLASQLIHATAAR